MLDGKTHVLIDGNLHKIHEIHVQDGVRHTHRVHTACGLTIDVDHQGAKHDAAAREHRVAEADAKARKDHGRMAVYCAHAINTEVHAQEHRADLSGPSSRWVSHTGVAATCSECARVEAGGTRLDFDTGFNPPAQTPEV